MHFFRRVVIRFGLIAAGLAVAPVLALAASNAATAAPMSDNIAACSQRAAGSTELCGSIAAAPAGPTFEAQFVPGGITTPQLGEAHSVSLGTGGPRTAPTSAGGGGDTYTFIGTGSVSPPTPTLSSAEGPTVFVSTRQAV